MITGELKNKIDALWEIFWTGGLTNPLDVIEQITYLMFIHDLDESDDRSAKESVMLGLPYQSIFSGEVQIGERTVDGNQLKWSVFHDFPAARMYSVMQDMVFPFIKNLHDDKNSAYSKYMGDAIFKLPTPLMLSKVVDSLDGIYDLMGGPQTGDVRGDVYEYLLAKIATAGVNGQFRTPRHIIRMMVELMDPGADDVICDPACGTSGFLVTAGEYLKETRKEEIFFDRQKKAHYMNRMFHGYDMDRTMLRIGAMNMMTHGIDNPFIEYRDSLSDQNTDRDAYSLILANPPFKGSLDADTVSPDLLKVCKTKKTELLFLALFLRMLRVGGRCACIVPDGVLFGSSKAHRVLVFTKTGHGGTDNVWFYDMHADGFSLDDKRTPVKDNDIPDIVARFRSLKLPQSLRDSSLKEGANALPQSLRDSVSPAGSVGAFAQAQRSPLETRALKEGADNASLAEGGGAAKGGDGGSEADRPRTAQSFLVPKAEIVENGYDLSINKYKKTEYKPVEYPPTSEILAELNEIEMEITKALAELEEMV